MSYYKVIENTVPELSDGQICLRESRRAELDERIKKLARKSKRASGALVSYTQVGSGYRSLQLHDDIHGLVGPRFRVDYIVIELSGAAIIRHAGWSFEATLQHVEDLVLIRRVPGRVGDLPEQFRSAPSTRCDHCGRDQRRKDTYVLSHEDGRWAVVGSTCVREFLGIDPTQAIEALQYAWKAFIGSQDEDDRCYSSRDGEAIFTLDFLAYTRAAIRKFGWTSRGKASEWGSRATADVVSHCLQDCIDQARGTCDWHFEPSDEDHACAAAALEWVRVEIAGRDNLSDYDHNLVVATSVDVVRKRTEGVVASLIPAYLRHVEQQEQLRLERESRPASEWVGTVGERINVSGTITRIRETESDWGVTTIFTIVADDGAVFTWFASGERDGAVGDRLNGKGTVKCHSEFKGQKQTVLSRCKF